MKKIIFLITVLLIGAFAKENLSLDQLKQEILAIRNSLNIIKSKDEGADLQKEMRTLENKNTLLRQWKNFNTLQSGTKNEVVFQKIDLMKNKLYLLKKQFPKKTIILRVGTTKDNEYCIGNKTTLLVDSQILNSTIKKIEKNYQKRELIDLIISSLSYIQKIKIPKYFSFENDVKKIEETLNRTISSETSQLANQENNFQAPIIGGAVNTTTVSQIAITTDDILGNNNLKVIKITNSYIEIGIQ